MSLINKIIINKMIENIKSNKNINIGISAIMMHGTTPIGDICSNIDRNYCRGMVCPSLHAEVNAVISHYGKSIRYSPTHGWKMWCLKETKEIKYPGG